MAGERGGSTSGLLAMPALELGRLSSKATDSFFTMIYEAHFQAC
jgi:hypothetical protein